MVGSKNLCKVTILAVHSEACQFLQLQVRYVIFDPKTIDRVLAYLTLGVGFNVIFVAFS